MRWLQAGIVAGLVATSAVVGLPASPAGAEQRSATCTHGDVTWRVTYEWGPGFGGVSLVTGLAKIQGGGAPVDASGSTWQLRWDKRAAWPAPPPPPPSGLAFSQIQGPLSSFSSQVVADLDSPRLVAPDGSCTVYLRPYPNVNQPIGQSVSVLGDELLAHLNDATVNQTWWQGYVERAANELGVRAEVEGHTGARWAAPPAATGLARSDIEVLDEFRGLDQRDTDGYVVALGANDAAYISAGGAVGSPGYIARRDEVTARLQTVAGEMTANSGCVVVVTAPEDGAGAYATAALELNNWVRFTASLDPGDPWSFVDFAAQAKGHKATDPDPWFAADNIHLAGNGLTAYTNAIKLAVGRCVKSAPVRPLDGTAFDLWNMTFHEGSYYATYNGSGVNFGIRKAPRLASLDDAQIQAIRGPGGDVFTAADLPADVRQNTGFGGHLIRWDERWYWFTGGGPAGQTKPYVLESEGDDPLGPYHHRATFRSPTAAEGGDGTGYQPSPFVVDGHLYLGWSSEQVGTTEPRLFITDMDTPWDTDIQWHLLVDPDTCWEGNNAACPGGTGTGRRVAEGASVVVRGQKIFYVYSANGYEKPAYAVGLLTADLADADRLHDPTVWTKKTDAPVFASNPAAGVWGPGNMTFFTSPDGTEDWIAYHVKTATASSPENRTLQFKRLDWDPDGNPVFGAPLPVDEHRPLPSGDPGGSFVEAEQGVLTGVSVVHSPTASGRTYVSGLTAAASKVKVWVDVPAAGTYPLRIWYTNTGSSPATHNVAINTAAPITVSYPGGGQAGRFPMARTTTVAGTFTAGWNEVSFTRGTGAADLDRIQVDVASNRVTDGVGATSPAVDAVEVFALDPANQVRTRRYTDAAQWGAWQTPGTQPAGGLRGAPAATSRNGRVEVAAIGRDGNVWASGRATPMAAWDSWASLGRPPAGVAASVAGVGIVSTSATTFEVFVLGDDRAIWRRAWTDGTGWGAWEKPNMPFRRSFISAPAAVSKQPNRVDLYVLGSDGQVYTATRNDSTWSTWTSMEAPNGLPATSAPAIASRDQDDLRLAVRGSDGQIWVRQWAAGWGWGSWTQVPASGGPATFSSAPGLVARAGPPLSVDAFGRSGASLYGSRYSTTWAPWTSLGSP